MTDGEQESTLRLTPITEIKALVDLLAELDIAPLHLHVDGRDSLDHRADIRLWMTTRTQFDAVCKALGAKTEERRYVQKGQRHFTAEVDTDTRRLLIQCVSLEHHPDWQPPGGES